MTTCTLCDQGLRVGVGGGGCRTLLVVQDSETARFWFDTAELESVLQGEAIQLSVKGTFCRLDRVGERVHLEYGQSGDVGNQCEFPVSELAEAIRWVRSRDDSKDGLPSV